MQVQRNQCFGGFENKKNGPGYTCIQLLCPFIFACKCVRIYLHASLSGGGITNLGKWVQNFVLNFAFFYIKDTLEHVFKVFEYMLLS